MTENELKIAKQNGFIFSGTVGIGKSTLINVLFNREVADAGDYALPIDTKSKVYYLKLKSGKYVSLIETPGIKGYNLEKNYPFKDALRTISEKKNKYKRNNIFN